MSQDLPSILIYGLAGDEFSRELPSILTEIKSHGWRVILITNRHFPGSEMPDRTIINSDWTYDLLKKISMEEGISACILMTDFASPLVGQLNEELNLPGPSRKALHACNDKVLWTDICKNAGVSTVPQKVLTQISDFLDEEWKNKKLFVKPSKSTSNLSDLSCGYSFFSGSEDLLGYLERTNELEMFINVNNHGGRLGRYLVQEAVERHKFWGSVNVTFLKDTWIIHEINNCLYHPEPHQNLCYSTYGPDLTVPIKYREYAEKICQLMYEQGFHSSPACFDLLETENGELCSLDINVRPSGTWNTLLPFRGISYYSAWIDWLLTGENKLTINDRPFLRHTLQLKANMSTDFSSFKWPIDVEVRGLDLIGKTCEVPEYCARTNFPVEAIIVRDTIQECFDAYRSIESSLEEYLKK